MVVLVPGRLKQEVQVVLIPNLLPLVHLVAEVAVDQGLVVVEVMAALVVVLAVLAGLMFLVG